MAFIRWLVIASALLGGLPCLGHAETQDILSVVAIGWEQNRAQIGDTFLCEFEINTMDATEPASPRLLHSRSGIWARQDGNVRFSLSCASEAAPTEKDERATTPGIKISGCVDTWILQTNDHRLVYAPILKAANIFTRHRDDNGVSTTPLSMGVMGREEKRSLEQVIQNHLDNGEGEIQILESSEPTINLRTEVQQISSDGVSWNNLMVWKVAPDSGFLPVEVTVLDDPETWSTKTVVKEVRQLENGGYWPMESVTTANPETSVIPRVIQISTSRLSFDPEDVARALALPVQKGIRIANPGNMRSSFAYAKVAVRPDQLESLYEQAEQSLGERDRQLAEIEPEPEPVAMAPPGPGRFWLMLIFTTLLLLVVTWVTRGQDTSR